MNRTATYEPARVLIVGRSPSVLLEAVDMLRAKGFAADATNQFDQVLGDYDVRDLDLVVFGGMVPAVTKEYLRAEISRRNPAVTLVQGLAGIPGVVAAQVESVSRGEPSAVIEITYDIAGRSLRVTLARAARVIVEVFWATSFNPPEPQSAAMQLLDSDLAAGTHDIPLSDRVPSEASFATVAVDAHVRVITIGGMPAAIRRMAPATSSDARLPGVAAVTTHGDDATLRRRADAGR